jgi:hypothetical protein
MTGMPRFVILEHDHPTLHWDLMLETSAGLRTWRLAAPPALAAIVAAEPLGLHRVAYLEYEGPVSGNRGTVKRWDRGEYVPLLDNDTNVEVELRGERVCGRATIACHGTGWSMNLEELRTE